MFNKTTVLVALLVVPSLYYLVRLTTWPLPVVLAAALHWGLACAVLVGTSSGRSGAPDIGLRRRLRGFLIFVAVVVGYCGALNWWFGSQPLAGWQNAQMYQLGRWGVILIAISAGFCEEVIYRGYMMTGLKHLGRPIWLAMILSSLSFVLFHGILPLPFMTAFFILSMMFSAIYQKTSVLWIPIYIHALWDATVLLVPWASASTPTT